MRIQDMPGVVWGIVLVGVFLGVGAIVLSEFATTQASGSNARMAIDNASAGVLNISKQLPTVGTIFGVLLIVGAVVMLFFYFRGKQY
jgi:hypothetical protein